MVNEAYRQFRRISHGDITVAQFSKNKTVTLARPRVTRPNRIRPHKYQDRSSNHLVLAGLWTSEVQTKGLGLAGTNGILGQHNVYRILDSLSLWPVLRPKYRRDTGTKN